MIFGKDKRVQFGKFAYLSVYAGKLDRKMSIARDRVPRTLGPKFRTAVRAYVTARSPDFATTAALVTNQHVDAGNMPLSPRASSPD
jgi:hypothetical protein